MVYARGLNLVVITGWFPHRRLRLCADGAYATLARDLPAGVHLTCRMRRDAALYQPAPPPRTGRRGRPRTKGERLPTPAQLSTTLPQRAFTTVQVDGRGVIVAKAGPRERHALVHRQQDQPGPAGHRA